MAIGINALNQNIFARPVESTVSGSELTKVAVDILSAKTSSITSALSGTSFGSKVDVSLYGTNATSNTEAVKLAATNTSGYELNLSQKALSAVNALNAKAATDVVNNIAQYRNGLIHVNAEKPEFTGLKNTFALQNSPSVFETMDLSKDRRGPGPFYVPRDTKEKVEKEEGLNLIA
jgi:hypothetical protein